MSFGPLSTLGAGRTAGGLIVRVDAETSLDHRYAVMSSVFTILIYNEREMGRERGIIIGIITQNSKTLSHTPSKGLQGMVLQVRS